MQARLSFAFLPPGPPPLQDRLSTWTRRRTQPPAQDWPPQHRGWWHCVRMPWATGSPSRPCPLSRHGVIQLGLHHCHEGGLRKDRR